MDRNTESENSGLETNVVSVCIMNNTATFDVFRVSAHNIDEPLTALVGFKMVI